MNKSIYFSFLFLFFSFTIFGQKNLNSYKYILIPSQYEFQKSQDSYQINSLTKFLFERAGFTAMFTNETYPSDLAANGCLGLKAVLNDNSGLFSTKMNIDLYDCRNTVIFSTSEGRSKEKDYKSAYHEAIRNTFEDLENLHYKYKPSVKDAEIVKVVKTDTETETDIKKEPIKVEEVAKVEKNTKVELDVTFKKTPVDVKNSTIETEKVAKPASEKSLEGKFFIEKWGICSISQKEDYFAVVGGDEQFEFAAIYKTSIPNVFIIKWAAFKQPRLLEIDLNGNLKVDGEQGDIIYKRIRS